MAGAGSTNRRLGLRAAAAFLLVLSVPAAAESAWPERPLTVIVPYAAGAATDILARALAETLREQLGEQVVILNREGASSTVGAAAIAQAKPDGYTFGFTAIGPITIQPHLNPALPYRPESFEAVCQTFDLPFTLAVVPESRFKSLGDIVEAAQAAPGKLSYGVTGTATIPHLAMIEWSLLSGLSFTDVPFKGEPAAIQSLRAGEINFAVVTPGAAFTNGLKMFATFTIARVPEVENVPTLGEFGWPVVQTVPGGLIAPRGVEKGVLQRLERACAAAVRSERYTGIMTTTRQPRVYRDSEAFGRAIAEDFRRKGELIRRANIKIP
jgi:tripartite-type tricarboxylate transporter receptor subunit TctC